MKPGDVIVIPAGVVHLTLESTDDFEMVGAYPAGSPRWDMCYGQSIKECEQKTAVIKKVPIPPTDPVTGQTIWA